MTKDWPVQQAAAESICCLLDFLLQRAGLSHLYREWTNTFADSHSQITECSCWRFHTELSLNLRLIISLTEVVYFSCAFFVCTMSTPRWMMWSKQAEQTTTAERRQTRHIIVYMDVRTHPLMVDVGYGSPGKSGLKTGLRQQIIYPFVNLSDYHSFFKSWQKP